jgi:hypothetical protein
MLQPDPRLWQAIEQKRMIRLVYHGKERVVEPHDHGVLNGAVQLLGYQVAGFSSRPLPNWILMKADEMADLKLSEKTFPGGRPRASGKHLRWDILFIRVQPPTESSPG